MCARYVIPIRPVGKHRDGPIIGTLKGLLSNHRDDTYGGSFENRTRLIREIDDEGKFRFRVLEIHRDVEKPRAHIQLICDDRIKPVEVVELSEIESAAP